LSGPAEIHSVSLALTFWDGGNVENTYLWNRRIAPKPPQSGGKWLKPPDRLFPANDGFLLLSVDIFQDLQ
jgi:hypothetical protein